MVNDNFEPPLRALVQYGGLLQLKGHKAAAAVHLNAALTRYHNGLAFSSEDVTMVALASQLLGDFHSANAFFNEATRADPENLEAHTLWADLFLQKYNTADAERGYREALAVNSRYVPALVGLARVLGEERAAYGALAVNPNSVPALEILGQMLLYQERRQEALNQFNRALELNPESLTTLGILAADALLHGNDSDYQKHRRQVEAFSPAFTPAHPAFLADVAEIIGRNYRFTEAVEHARAALQADPEYWRGYGLLGNNLLRLGEEEEGRRYLETGFDNDPFNMRTLNLLTVFDTLDTYQIRESEHFKVVLSERDAQVLWPYLEPLLEEAWADLTAKYRFEPQTPVLIEMFDKTEDFAVRSVGLPDIGPLVGICFGRMITLISPDTLSANWQEIVWHEFVHVITLQMTRNRIPRWLSEGVSVWEERQARPYWGREQGLDLIRAVQDGRLLPVARLNTGFTGAQSSADLGFAYFQAYLVVEFIAEEFGFERLLELVHQYGQFKDDDARFSAAFDMGLDAFDDRFRAWAARRASRLNIHIHEEDRPDRGEGHGHGVRENSSAVLAELYSNASLIRHMQERLKDNPRDFQAHLQLGIVLFKEERFNEAKRHLNTAHRLLPGYSGYPSPPLVLSQIYEAEGDRGAQLAQLRLLLENQQHDFSAAMTVAEAALDAEDYEQAAYYIGRALEVDPYRSEVHRLKARLAEAVDDPAAAVTEYEVLLTLDDTDPVRAYTDLAEAYLRNGQPEAAKRNILYALETAPGFRRAQRLLLQTLQDTDD